MNKDLLIMLSFLKRIKEELEPSKCKAMFFDIISGSIREEFENLGFRRVKEAKRFPSVENFYGDYLDVKDVFGELKMLSPEAYDLIWRKYVYINDKYKFINDVEWNKTEENYKTEPKKTLDGLYKKYEEIERIDDIDKDDILSFGFRFNSTKYYIDGFNFDKYIKSNELEKDFEEFKTTKDFSRINLFFDFFYTLEKNEKKKRQESYESLGANLHKNIEELEKFDREKILNFFNEKLNSLDKRVKYVTNLKLTEIFKEIIEEFSEKIEIVR